jgi:hypothetical protein
VITCHNLYRASSFNSNEVPLSTNAAVDSR